MPPVLQTLSVLQIQDNGTEVVILPLSQKECMNSNEMKIGYVPYSADLTQPGDRRRFPYFARRSDTLYEVADPSKNYDIILLTGSSNLSLWLAYKKKHPHTRFIFEMVDSLIFDPNFYFKIFKGAGRFLNGKEKGLWLNYSRLIFKWIQLADAVLCSNEVLINHVLELNSNAFLSPDYLESEYHLRKKNYALQDGRMNLVWEGLSSVVPFFSEYRDMLAEVSSFCKLHIISNEKYPAIPGLYYKDTRAYLKQLPIETIFYPWDLNTHNEILVKGDCAIIPINRKMNFAWNKPANKLVSFWFSGLPTITSDTPAYLQLMNGAELEWSASNKREWVDKLKALYEMKPEARAAIGEKGFRYAKEHFSDEKLDSIWQSAFASIE